MVSGTTGQGWAKSGAVKRGQRGADALRRQKVSLKDQNCRAGNRGPRVYSKRKNF